MRIEIVPAVDLKDLIVPDDDALYHDPVLRTAYYNYYFSYGRHFRPHRVYEIGVRMGYTGYFILSGAGGSVKKYRGIDLESYRHGSSAHARSLLGRLCDDVDVVVGNSHALSQLDDVYDLIHIDGDHSYAGKMADLDLAFRSLAPGGIVVVDDCYPYRHKHPIYKAVTDFVKLHDVEMEFLHPLCGSALNPLNGHALLSARTRPRKT